MQCVLWHKPACLQDAGGEDRPFSDSLLQFVDYLIPNESELQRITEMPTDTEEQVNSIL